MLRVSVGASDPQHVASSGLWLRSCSIPASAMQPGGQVDRGSCARHDCGFDDPEGGLESQGSVGASDPQLVSLPVGSLAGDGTCMHVAHG
jgi:hypothetical protein